MNRCIELAKKAIGNTYPNPLVGAVLVHQNKIIGEGWHQKAGQAHAEVIALNQVSEKSLFSESTLYVNLEPCSHFGKTPPCADLIIKSGIKKVVIASTDPNPKVAGNGILKLKKAGIEVVENVLKDEAEWVNRRFYTFHQKKRPYLILKWAESKDGFMAPDQKQTKRPFWISNKLAKQKVHQWRSEESSILVGVQTVIEDNPMLTTREWPGKNPLRLILDPSNRINSHATVLNDKFPTVVLNRERNLPFEKQHISRAVLDPYSLESLMKFCYTQNLLSLFVEGGQKTLTSFLRNDLWDEVRVFQSENDIKKGLKAPVLNTPHHNEEKIGDNWLKIYFNQTIPSKIQDIV